MALDFIMVPVNIAGMDTKTDDFVLNPGSASELKNVWMDRSGKYQTRYGYAQLAAAQSDAVAVSDWHGDILRWRESTVEKIDSAGVRPTGAKLLAGSYQMFDVGGEIVGFNDFTDEFSYAEGPDYGIFTKTGAVGSTEWIDVQFVDLESKKTFYSMTIRSKTVTALDSGSSPIGAVNVSRATVVPTATGIAMVMWNQAVANTFILVDHWVGFDGSGFPTRVLENAVADNTVSGKTIGNVDCVHISGAIAIAYSTSADTYLSRVTLSTGAASFSQLSTDVANILAISAKDSTTGVVIWEVGTGGGPYTTDFKRRDFSLASGPTGSATTIISHTGIGTSFSPSRISVLWDGSLYHMAWDWDANAGAASGTYPGPSTLEYFTSASGTRNALDRRVQLASRLFAYDGEICLFQSGIPIGADSTNNAIALRTFGDPDWPAWSDILFQSRARPGSKSGPMPVVTVSSRTITTILPYSGNQKNQAKIVVRSPTAKPMFGYWNRVLIHNVTPHLSYFDGRGNYPAGFPTWPSISAAASGSGSFTGTYGFAAVWERTDNEGNVWRSAPSLVSSVVASSDAQFDITVQPPPFYSFTSIDDDSYQIVIYRTTANGTIFYRVYSEPAESSTVVIVDTATDADIASNPLIYTDGGALENVMPPAIEAWALARDRLFLISAEDQNVYPTKLRVSGEGVGFSDALRISLAGSGDLRAIGAMDDKVIVFGDESHTVLYGVGPDDFGAGQFEQQLMSDDVGCIDPRSVILGDKGLFFQSRKGLWLLGRDLSSVPVGIPMDIYKTSTFVGAMSPSDRMLHWWFLSSGTILVYDEYHNRWSRFLTTGVKSSALVDTKPVFLTSTGAVWREDTSLYTDNGSAYECQATLGWLSFAGLQGFQKVRRISLLGESQAAAFNCVAKVYYDFVDTLAETVTAANATVKPSGTAYVWEWKPKRQKCEAIKLDFTWTASGTGASIVSLGFEVGGIPGLARRIKAAKRVKGV